MRIFSAERTSIISITRKFLAIFKDRLKLSKRYLLYVNAIKVKYKIFIKSSMQ